MNQKKKRLKVKETLYKIYKFIVDWRMAVSFAIAWMITNGWAYVFIILGKILDIKWMFAVGVSYIAILWLPFTPEKLITIPLSVFIKKILFRRKKEKNE